MDSTARVGQRAVDIEQVSVELPPMEGRAGHRFSVAEEARETLFAFRFSLFAVRSLLFAFRCSRFARLSPVAALVSHLDDN